MSKKKQVTIEDMEKAMAIELLPAKEIKEASRSSSVFFCSHAEGYEIRY